MNTCLHCDGTPDPGEDLCPRHLTVEMAVPQHSVSPVPREWRPGYVRPQTEARRRRAA